MGDKKMINWLTFTFLSCSGLTSIIFGFMLIFERITKQNKPPALIFLLFAGMMLFSTLFLIYVVISLTKSKPAPKDSLESLLTMKWNLFNYQREKVAEKQPFPVGLFLKDMEEGSQYYDAVISVMTINSQAYPFILIAGLLMTVYTLMS